MERGGEYRNLGKRVLGFVDLDPNRMRGRLLHETGLGAFVHNQNRSNWPKSRRRSEEKRKITKSSDVDSLDMACRWPKNRMAIVQNSTEICFSYPHIAQ